MRHAKLTSSSLALVVAACTAVPGARVSVFEPLPHPAELVPRHRPIDVEHYALELALHPAERRIEGRARVRFWPVPGVAGIDYVELDLDGLDARAVRDHAGRELVFSHMGGVLGVTLAEPLRAGSYEELAIEYGGTPVKGLWFADVEDGVPTQVFTQGECEDARGWFPCNDDPSDRATFELAVDVPRAWTTLSAGIRTERVERGDRAVESWRMDAPHPPYLDTLVAGEFVTKTGAWEGVPLVFLADPRLEADMDACFEPTGAILTLFSRLTGTRYPFPKYAQAAVAEFPFGGMENVSATTLTETALGDARFRRDAPMDGLVAHEAAHQWFGDLLTCETWSEIWLNEGFATFFTALWTEHSRGRDEYEVAVRKAQEFHVTRDAGRMLRPVVHGLCRQPMDLFFTGHVYPGGAARLHYLRCLLGEAAFFRGIELYVGQNRDRSVVTDDLRVALEEASGRPLQREFDQWFRTPGHPWVRSTWRHVDGKVELTVEQLHPVERGVPASFDATVEVELAFGAERRTERIELDARARVFTFPAAERPDWVLFDARSALPCRRDDVRAVDEWLAILGRSDRAVFRIDALAALAKAIPSARGEARDRIFAAVLRAGREEASPSVREAAVPALRAFGDAASSGALRSIAASDERAGARCAALDALRPKGPDAELARFAEEQYAAGFSWNTMAHAAALLVVARPTGAFDWIQRERARPSPHGVLEAQLLTALSHSTEPAARAELLRTALDAAEHEGVRVSAVNALGERIERERELAKALLPLLDTGGHRLRQAAIGALGNSKESAIRAALRARWDRAPLALERYKLQEALDPGTAARHAR